MHDIAEWFWMGKSIYGFGWFLLKDNPEWFWMGKSIYGFGWFWMVLDGPSETMVFG